MKRLHLYLTKDEIDPERLAGHTAIVIDVVLATSTMISLMERGARRVFPVSSGEEGLQLLGKLDRSKAILGGEHGGYKIDGYDAGPHPDEYPREVVEGKDIVFLSSNGTRAIGRARTASTLLLASLRNAPSVADFLKEKFRTAPKEEKLFIICSGSGGQMCLEDLFCAGLIISQLDLTEVPYNDSAQLALEFIAANREEDPINVMLRSRVGRHFQETNQLELLRFASDVGAATSLVEVKTGTQQDFDHQCCATLNR
jgi:2-phosphosulfolactate phosphatase